MANVPKQVSVLGFAAFMFRHHWLVVGLISPLIVAAGLLDAVGISLFVPMASFIVGDTTVDTNNAATAWVEPFISFFGLPFTLVGTMVLLVGVMVAKGAAMFLQRWALAVMRARFEVTMKNQLYGAVLDADWPFIVSHRTGGVANLLIVEARRTGTAFEIFIAGFSALGNVLIYLLLALFVSWQVTLVAAGGAIILSFAFRSLVGVGKRTGRAMTDANERLAAEITDTIGGAKVVKVAAMEEFAQSRLDMLVRRLAHVDIRLGMIKGVLESTYEPAFIALLVVAIFVATRLIDVSNSTLMLFTLLTFRMFQRSRTFQSMVQALVQATPGFDYLRTVERDAIAHREDDGGNLFPGLQESIEFREVAYSWGRGEPVLRDVSLRIAARNVTAFVGHSGGGKTTILDLLTGLLRPNHGSILVDGVPLEEYSRKSWRARIGYVTQDTVLFDDTIAANIGWGLGDIQEEDTRRVAKMAHIDHVIDAMPDGYQTLVGERGMELSGGQRQRIALARALARHPDILLLDEATSELDAESEASIQAALQELRGQVTVVVVAHRLSSITQADQVYVLNQGRVAEEGSASSLLERGGIFYRLYRELQGQPEGTE